MKSILVPTVDKRGFEQRTRAATAVAEQFGGYLTFLHGTPVDDYVATDPFGGGYFVQAQADAARELAGTRKKACEAMMEGTDVPWRFVEARGAQEDVLVEYSRLADLIVLSDPPASDREDADAASATTYVVMSAGCPVLSIPEGPIDLTPGSKAIVAWNGSAPAGRAMRQAVPLLARASAVDIVTIGADPDLFSAEAAAVYLNRHDIDAKVVIQERSKDIAQQMHDLLVAEEAGLLVLGAFSHSRVREFVFGGVSRHFIRNAPVPVFMAH